MKATNSTAQASDPHPPLARDAQGNLLPLPEGTCAWRICRHTKGRPRIVNGLDKQPARFPLDITAEELVDTCGADTYRVYALDEVGNVIDYVTTVETQRELRNAAEPEVVVLPAPRGASTSSDLRYALEAMTHMARTNADAMRAVAESQADWIKALSAMRGFFRNAPPPQLSPPGAEDRDAPEEDDDEVDDRRAGWVDSLQPIVGVVVQQLVGALLAGKKPTAGGASSRWELADLFDWRRAARKREQAAALAEAPTAAAAPLYPAALQQALAGKAMVVGQLLEPDERSRLMKLAPKLMQLAADSEISKLLAELVAMAPDDAAQWLRAHLESLEKGLTS